MTGTPVEPERAAFRKPGRLQLAALAAAALLIVSVPWWGPRALSNLSFFRLENIEMRGAQFISESDLLELLAVDTTGSIWMDVRPLEERVATHPQVESVSIGRRMPGTLVVRIVEKRPVALIASAEGFVVVDEQADTMPVDPASTNIDLPILRSTDTLLVRFLSEVMREQPSIFSRISEIRRVGNDEMRIQLPDHPVRAMSDITAQRLADILPVERDLRARGIKVVELDLRYRGQVIARLK